MAANAHLRRATSFKLQWNGIDAPNLGDFSGEGGGVKEGIAQA